MSRKSFDLEKELPKAIARLRELADEDGIAPSQTEYRLNRGDCVAIDFFKSRGVAYSELVRRAGLTKHRSGRRSQGSVKAPGAPSRGVPPEVEAEINAAFARGDHIDQRRKEWPLFAIPTRIETVLIPQGDSTALKITRYYASLR